MSKKSFILSIVLFIFSLFLLDRLLNEFLEKGLNKYYGIGESNEIALIGHSHLMLGLNKLQIEEALKKGVSKYTREGVNVSDRLVMTKQLLKKNTNLKTVIYGVDAWTFTGEGLSENSYKLFYPFLDDPIIDDYVYNNSERVEYISKKYLKSSRYNEQLISGAMRGYLKNWTNLKYGIVDTLKLMKTIENQTFRKINNNSDNIRVLEETLSLLRENNINVILLNLPTIDKLTTIQKEDFNNTFRIFKNLTNDQVEFVDFQEPWSHRYDLFFDPIHLNPKGQSLITEKLIECLKFNDNE